jgi:hypothetical protein
MTRRRLERRETGRESYLEEGRGWEGEEVIMSFCEELGNALPATLAIKILQNRSASKFKRDIREPTS